MEKYEQISLRLPDGWRRALKIAAAVNGRSMNAEIVQRLRPTLEAADAQRPQS
ncbi:Arc family DNA-binding protein [Paracoccus sp. N5]|uniref:Arc family DNA-binding protein n=1 Tax=Paracoccus sp. N5 TaxID=1101189 RepID=UPI00035F38FF|nr:Arc family DNA-binding protein [Paracoccus sp. N5]